jgi:hypothetical protein
MALPQPFQVLMFTIMLHYDIVAAHRIVIICLNSSVASYFIVAAYLYKTAAKEDFARACCVAVLPEIFCETHQMMRVEY